MCRAAGACRRAVSIRGGATAGANTPTYPVAAAQDRQLGGPLSSSCQAGGLGWAHLLHLLQLLGKVAQALLLASEGMGPCCQLCQAQLDAADIALAAALAPLQQLVQQACIDVAEHLWQPVASAQVRAQMRQQEQTLGIVCCAFPTDGWTAHSRQVSHAP